MRSRRPGFALVTVLWALVVIGVLALEFHTLARADRRVATNARAAVQARWAARAGLARTLAALDQALTANELRPVGDTVLGPNESEESGVAVRTAVLDLNARLNLNRASRRELLRLMEALTISPIEAEQLIGAIRVAPIDRVEQLRSVPGVTASTYDRVAPYVTVAGDGRINVNSASVPVLLSLAEMDGDAARAVLARRAAAPFRNVFEVVAALPAPLQTRMQARLGELLDRITFTPRAAAIVVTAAVHGENVQSDLMATVLFSGGVKWSLQETVERFSGR